jgi:hypothetical protein
MGFECHYSPSERYTRKQGPILARLLVVRDRDLETGTVPSFVQPCDVHIRVDRVLRESLDLTLITIRSVRTADVLKFLIVM